MIEIAGALSPSKQRRTLALYLRTLSAFARRTIAKSTMGRNAGQAREQLRAMRVTRDDVKTRLLK